ncbi:MAG: N-acetylmuramoyl-L-alanine amidase [Thermodesulfobacteriota bacterium]
MKKPSVWFIAALLFLAPPLVQPLFGEGRHGDAGVLKTIVIDPGHGGIDTGAIGPTGVMEKDINLAIAQELAELLSKKPGLKIILTRRDDQFIPLTERTAIANRSGADLFISIHTNASLRKVASGVETYFLSFDASDDDARRVAAFENGVVKFEEEASDHQNETDYLKLILWDMTQTEFLNESSLLAETIHERLTTVIKGEERGVKQAPFIVLIGAAMPAVLVEVGFITNPEEERHISQSTTQEAIASSVFESINRFEELLATKWEIEREKEYTLLKAEQRSKPAEEAVR